MSLDNLVKIGRLKPHPPDREEIADLLSAARRNLQDARAENISTENRFDAAYKCIMQSALAGLLANGFRPDTKSPGHHATIIQTLPKTVGIETDRIPLLDALRNKRNLADYTGRDLDLASLRSCINEAERLMSEVSSWLASTHPHLSPKG